MKKLRTFTIKVTVRDINTFKKYSSNFTVRAINEEDAILNINSTPPGADLVIVDSSVVYYPTNDGFRYFSNIETASLN